MNTDANLHPSAPTAADPAGSGKLVESRGVEALHVSTGETANTNPWQPPRQQSPLGSIDPESRDGVMSRVRSAEVDIDDLRDRLAEIEKRTPAGMAKLRAAAAEALLAAGLVMAEIEGERHCQRLLKAMEQLREALS